MLKIISCNTTQCVFHPVATLERAEELQSQGNLLWLDLHNPSESELTNIGERFSLHPLAIEDASQEHQRPKIEMYDTFLFVVFYSISPRKSTTGEIELAISELDVFVGKNYLITVHREILPELVEAETRWIRSEKLREGGVGALLYVLLDTLVDRYFPLGDTLVAQAEYLEDSIFTGTSRGSQVTLALLELKKLFLELRRIILSKRDVLNVLSNRDSHLFAEGVNLYFRDINDHLTHLSDTLDLYRDQLSSTMDANLSLSSHDLNKVMRALTATSVILMSDALIAGIYGMNFDFIPETKWHYGYFAVLGFMFLVSLLLVFFFKRLRWF